MVHKTRLNLGKRRYLPHGSSDKGLKGTNVNRKCPALNVMSLESTPTVCNVKCQLILNSNIYLSKIMGSNWIEENKYVSAI